MALGSQHECTSQPHVSMSQVLVSHNWPFLESRGWPGAQLCRLLLPGPPLGLSCPSEKWVQQQGFLGSVWVNEGLPATDKSPPRGTWGSLLFLLLQDTKKMV